MRVMTQLFLKQVLSYTIKKGSRIKIDSTNFIVFENKRLLIFKKFQHFHFILSEENCFHDLVEGLYLFRNKTDSTK